MDRFGSTRSKNGVVVETPKTISTTPNLEIDSSTDHQRVHQSFPDETYQNVVDDGNFIVVNQGVGSIDSKQKLNVVWPVYDLCNVEGSKLHNFIQNLIVFPRLIVTAANRPLLNVVNNLAATEAAGKGDGRFEFYYVSAGPLGNGYYLSTLLFRHSIYESEPIVPAAYMIHERKNPDDHRRLFELIQEKCPEVAATECVFITDREFGDIKSVLPSSLQFFSWHYFEDEIVTWVDSNGGTNDEANTFINDVFTLMKCKTVDQFQRELALKRRQWPADFLHYFETCLKADIVSKGGRWHAESGQRGIYDPFCGVVIPSCTDLNQLVSDLVEWQDVTIDQMLQCVYYFSEYYARENEMAMHHAGNYQLKSRFAQLGRPTRRLRAFAPLEVAEPRDVVNYVRTCSMVSR